MGLEIAVTTHHAAGAMDALTAGDRTRHDPLIAVAADERTHCDALMLCQYSRGPARRPMAEVPGRQILASPDAAASQLKGLLTGG